MKINDSELFTVVNGSGVPLMLMHGGMGFDHTYFRPWLDPLSDRMQLIYYDHRGNGRSSFLRDFTGIDHQTWAEDADALRRHLGHDKIFLLGHSAGGFIALEYALRYGRHLAGLILCCTVPVLDYPGVIMANAQARSTGGEQMQMVVNLFTTPLLSNEQMRTGLETLLPLYFKNYDQKTGKDLVNAIHFNYHAFNHCPATWFPSVNFVHRLKEISVPTLIISGSADWIMPPAEGGQRLHAGIRGSELEIFHQSGHYPFIEEPETFLTIIRSWIASRSNS